MAATAMDSCVSVKTSKVENAAAAADETAVNLKIMYCDATNGMLAFQYATTTCTTPTAAEITAGTSKWYSSAGVYPGVCTKVDSTHYYKTVMTTVTGALPVKISTTSLGVMSGLSLLFCQTMTFGHLQGLHHH